MGMTREEYDAVEAKILAQLDGEIASLRSQLDDAESKLELSLAANTKLTESLRTTLTRADTTIAQMRTGGFTDYAMVIGGLVAGAAVGYYGQRYLGKMPLMLFPGVILISAGFAVDYRWPVKGSMILGGVGMTLAGVHVYIQDHLPPRATHV